MLTVASVFSPPTNYTGSFDVEQPSLSGTASQLELRVEGYSEHEMGPREDRTISKHCGWRENTEKPKTACVCEIRQGSEYIGLVGNGKTLRGFKCTCVCVWGSGW